MAGTPHQDLNAAFLTCYLPAHEFLHLAAGSFQFHFRSRRGSYLRRLLTIRLYRLLERWLVKSGVCAEELAPFRSLVDLEEVLIRRALAEMAPDDTGIATQGPPEADPEFRIERAGIWVDEWYLDERLERQVYVTLGLFQASRPYQLPPPLHLVFPDLGLARRLDAQANHRYWNNDGNQIADDRLADWRAERRAGVAEGARVFFELGRPAATLDVTFLFDLSISMEARRRCLNGDSAIERAIQAASWLAEHLENQAVEVSAFGGIDGGIHDVQLLELPRPAARSIRSLRCQGAGGFRLGPLLRGIAQTRTPIRSGVGQRRLLTIVLTDGEPGYLSTAAERIFSDLHRANCPDCTQRRQCRIERARGALDARTDPAPPIFQNQHVALRDVQHAVKELGRDACASVHVLVFNDHVDEELWNARLGETGWSRVLNTSDLLRFTHRLLTMLRPAE